MATLKISDNIIVKEEISEEEVKLEELELIKAQLERRLAEINDEISQFNTLFSELSEVQEVPLEE